MRIRQQLPFLKELLYNILSLEGWVLSSITPKRINEKTTKNTCDECLLPDFMFWPWWSNFSKWDSFTPAYPVHDANQFPITWEATCCLLVLFTLYLIQIWHWSHLFPYFLGLHPPLHLPDKTILLVSFCPCYISMWPRQSPNIRESKAPLWT